MTHHFCTLFDLNYLTRGLAMYKSLKEHCSNFHLYIFAFDDKALEILNKLALDKVTVISLQKFEDDTLLALKPTRSKAEYCWTCTPSVILYVINHYPVENCTYIDADLYFYSSPNVLFDEIGDKSVLITAHRYAKISNREKLSGKYCVQFITFKNDTNGLTVLNWWRNACNEWCFNRYEDGKFGDQKYLDDWTTRFNGVHELQHLGGGLAPWNIQQYTIHEKKNKQLSFKNKQGLTIFEAVFYHFHYVRFYKNNLVDLGWFVLSGQIVRSVYCNYVNELDRAEDMVQQIEPGFLTALRPFSVKDSEGLKEKIKILIKLIFRYNLYRKENMLKNK